MGMNGLPDIPSSALAALSPQWKAAREGTSGINHGIFPYATDCTSTS